MKSHSFKNMDSYHKNLAARFRRRKVHLGRKQLRCILAALNFSVSLEDIDVAHSGNMSRVYLTSKLAVKIRDRKNASDQSWQFLANKVVSDRFYPELPVVNVLAYDHFEKTNYEVIVMERAKGKLLIDDFIKLEKNSQKELFGQILQLSEHISDLTFSDWGSIKDNDSYKTFTDFLKAKIDNYTKVIIDQNLANKNDVQRIKHYFLNRVNIFDDEKTPHFIHTDINIANALYQKDKISLLYDFDSAIKGPRLMLLPKIFSSVDNLGEIVDGTHYLSYRNIKFEHLYPVIMEKMPDIFLEKKLKEKLNLILIYRGLRLVAKNRYDRWNKIIIRDIVKNEIVTNHKSLSQTYYGQILVKMGVN